MKIMRSILAYLNILFFLLILNFLFPVYLILKISSFESYFVNFSFFVLRLGIKISLWIAGIKIVITGSENIHKKNNTIIIGNHIAAIDPAIFIYTFIQPFVFLAKKSLLKIPLINFMLIVLGTIFVDRKSIKSAAKTEIKAIKLIREGRNVCIFPEGTRNRGGETKKFKKGAIKISLKANAYILPITIYNSDNFFIKKIIFNSGLSIYVHIHPSIDVSNLSKDEINNLNNIIRNKIVKKLEDMEIQYITSKDLNEDTRL